MRKILIGVFAAFIVLLLTASWFLRPALACELLPLLNYQQVGEEVFFRADVQKSEIEEVQEFIQLASERIDTMYGPLVSKPRFLIASDIEMSSNWGANATATMHRLPWRSCIVIGPEGRSVDVIAHEWFHAEIQHRVGFLRFLKEIPVWFDEGAALTLDYRAPFLPENIDLPPSEIQAVVNLTRGSNFFSGNVHGNYQAARMAVRPLIEQGRFYDDLERISSGESFEHVFMYSGKSVDLE